MLASCVIYQGRLDHSTAYTHNEDIRYLFEKTSVFDEAGKFGGTAIQHIKPIFIQQTDGGPDENLCFAAVQQSAAHLFVRYKMDTYILVRAHPGGSYLNPCERKMAYLNKPLNGLCLAIDKYGSHLNASST